MAQTVSTEPAPAREAAEAVTGREAPAPPGAAHAAVEHQGKSGLPQLEAAFWGGQIVWLVVLFALLYALIATVFAPRLRKVRDDRAAAIDGAIADARRAQAETDAQAAAAKRQMDEARAKAQAAATDAKTRVAAEARERQLAQEAELNTRLEAAEARIRASRDAAMASVREVAADTAGAIVERLTGRAATPAEVEGALAAAPARA